MIIDITQEVFSCNVWPGDPVPEGKRLSRMEDGALYNLSSFSMCAHNGTHVDAPKHFIADGRTITELPPEAFVGPCWVARGEGDIGEESAKRILADAEAHGAGERILIGGKVTVTEAAARVFAGLRLVGNESQTVGPENAPMAVHLILLGAGTVLLEGIRLDGVAEGKYHLSALPLKLEGFEGAPCRAYLMTEE